MNAQTFDPAKLDLLFDRLLEKNKGMGGRVDHQDLHRRDDLSARRGRTVEAHGHARQILPADPHGRDHSRRAQRITTGRLIRFHGGGNPVAF